MLGLPTSLSQPPSRLLHPDHGDFAFPSAQAIPVFHVFIPITQGLWYAMPHRPPGTRIWPQASSGNCSPVFLQRRIHNVQVPFTSLDQPLLNSAPPHPRTSPPVLSQAPHSHSSGINALQKSGFVTKSIDSLFLTEQEKTLECTKLLNEYSQDISAAKHSHLQPCFHINSSPL